MSFYDDLKKQTKKEDPKPLTVQQQIAQNYQQYLQTLFGDILNQCKIQASRGNSSWVSCTRLGMEDGKAVIHAHGISPEESWAQLNNSGWGHQYTHAKNACGPNSDISVRRNWIAEKSFGLNMDAGLRDRFVRDLNKLLEEEGFPKNCVSGYDYDVEVEGSYSFFTGKTTSWVKVGTWHFIEIKIHW